MKVLIIGETCTDVFMYGDCERLSPEAPVPVMKLQDTKENEGMAGNVKRNVISLDPKCEVSLWSNENKIYKTRFVDRKSNHMFLRLDTDDKVDPLVLSSEKKDFISSFDCVIVSDYHKGLLTDNLLEQIGEKSKLSILDSKRKLTKSIVDSYTFVKLNESESNNNKDLKESTNILVTLGPKGCNYKGKNYPSPKPQETIDVSGAGDTFTAAFILKYFETTDVEQSIVFANEMASVVVNKRGVATPL